MRIGCYLAGVVILLLSLATFAQTDERDMGKEGLIWEQLQIIAPQEVETFKAATVALDNSNYQEAARLYEQVYKQAPEFDAVMRRLGLSFVYSGRQQEGIALLEKAIQKKRSPENLVSLAQCLAFPAEDKAVTRKDQERALSLAKEAEIANTDDPDYTLLVAQLAYDLQEEQDFRNAVKRLQKYPKTMAIHLFNAIVAVMDESWITADEEIKKAQSLGLPDEVVNRFLAQGVQTKATVWRYVYSSLYIAAAWIGGLALLFMLGKLMSKATTRWIEKADPDALASNSHSAIRKYYRWLINVAGIYYYVSIPILIFFVPAIVAAVTYAFYVSGTMPVKLIALMAVGAIVTVYQLVRSLIIRAREEDPGRALREDEAPQLWTLVREVAQTVGTRPVDEIRVTPGTEMAVYERGSFKERAQDRAHRVLILGVGLLNGFEQNAFRAVLAHEYGHFSHRDTAGGDVAIRVNNDMMKFAIAMIQSGQAAWWNVAFQFLRAYNFIFRRISHGATRLQEVMADCVAVSIYTPKAFEKGLTHVIRRQVEFEDTTYWEIKNAGKERRAINNLYELSADHELRIEEKMNEALNRPTTEDDTHPCPADRFRYASRIASKRDLPPAGMVWDLFANKDTLTNEMSDLIEKQVRAMDEKSKEFQLTLID